MYQQTMSNISFSLTLKGCTPFVSKSKLKCILKRCFNPLSEPRKILGPIVWFSSVKQISKNEPIPEISLKEEAKIIQCLNSLTVEQMRKEKYLSIRLSELICKYRKNNGPFTTLKDIEKIKSIGPISVKTICDKLLDKDGTSSLIGEDLLHKNISPELTQSFIASISTVTALEVCLDSVCFSTISRDLNLLQWNHVDLIGSNHQKQSPAQILDQAVHVFRHLPRSNIVLMENRSARKITTHYLHYFLFIGRLQMALQTLINENLSISGQHKVFHLKDSFVAKNFELRVGGERVSGQNIVQKIQNGQSSHVVTVAPTFWQSYGRLESDILKERYTNCFLMSLAFCQHAFTNRSTEDISDLQ